MRIVENNRHISKNNGHFFREILKRIMGKNWGIMGSCLAMTHNTTTDLHPVRLHPIRRLPFSRIIKYSLVQSALNWGLRPPRPPLNLEN